MEESQEKLLGSVTIAESIIEDIRKNVKNISDFAKGVESRAAENTTDLLGAILLGAIELDASDIHIEPQKDQIRLRVRIDGILQDVFFFTQEIYHTLLSRLKLLSKLKLNVTKKSQDGRFTISIADSLVEIRISTLPSEWGESIVMRILNPKNLMELETLGLRKDSYRILDIELKKPTGMIVAAGPTGSGKTTTLYAVLAKIHNPGIKIITIEDPIEYHLTGISQTQAVPEKGYGFAEGLASIVRQDPDVVLIGEIRDTETAKIAVQASLTGHLVLSTLHTNDAAGTIPRLADLGVDLSSIASALKIVISQRLVRKVCSHCSSLTKPSAEELGEIKKGLKGVPKEILKENNIDPALKDVKISKISPKGCKECNFTGYKGRKGIFEIFLVDSEMEKFILKNPPVSSIKEMLLKKGLISTYQAGIIEVLLKETTFDEVKRVAGAEQWFIIMIYYIEKALKLEVIMSGT